MGILDNRKSIVVLSILSAIPIRIQHTTSRTISSAINFPTTFTAARSISSLFDVPFLSVASAFRAFKAADAAAVPSVVFFVALPGGCFHPARMRSFSACDALFTACIAAAFSSASSRGGVFLAGAFVCFGAACFVGALVCFVAPICLVVRVLVSFNCTCDSSFARSSTASFAVADRVRACPARGFAAAVRVDWAREEPSALRDVVLLSARVVMVVEVRDACGKGGGLGGGVCQRVCSFARDGDANRKYSPPQKNFTLAFETGDFKLLTLCVLNN